MKELLLLLLFSMPPALAAESALTTCRQIEDILERVGCYDEYVDARYRESLSDSVDASASPEPTETSTAPDPKSLFGTTDAEAKRIIEATYSIEQIDQIEATVSDVQKSATRKLIVILDNGQVWRQLDSEALRIKSGEAVIIRKASLGSYLMEKKSGSRSIRVKRAN